MEYCAWCKKKKGILETFTKYGYCESCDIRIREDITSLKKGMDTLLTQANRSTDSNQKNNFFENLDQLYNALKLYKERQVPFFKSDLEEVRHQIVLAVNAIPESVVIHKSTSKPYQDSEAVQKAIAKNNTTETLKVQATSTSDIAPTVAAMQYAYMQQDLDLKQQQLETQQQALELQQQQLNSQARCPRCGSTSLSGNKKGYGVGKAAVGVFLAGPIGLVAGGIGSNKVKVTCLKCGHKFNP